MRRRRLTSYQLSRLKDELRKRAIAEQDEDKRQDYWRLFYKALHAEGEVREMVLEAEVRRLVEFLAADGRYGDFPMDDDSADTPQTPPDDDIDDNDIPPRQRPLWD